MKSIYLDTMIWSYLEELYKENKEEFKNHVNSLKSQVNVIASPDNLIESFLMPYEYIKNRLETINLTISKSNHLLKNLIELEIQTWLKIFEEFYPEALKTGIISDYTTKGKVLHQYEEIISSNAVEKTFYDKEREKGKIIKLKNLAYQLFFLKKTNSFDDIIFSNPKYTTNWLRTLSDERIKINLMNEEYLKNYIETLSKESSHLDYFNNFINLDAETKQKIACRVTKFFLFSEFIWSLLIPKYGETEISNYLSKHAISENFNKYVLLFNIENIDLSKYQYIYLPVLLLLSQKHRKNSEGNFVDQNHSSYIVDADYFVTSDEEFLKAIQYSFPTHLKNKVLFFKPKKTENIMTFLLKNTKKD